MKKIVIKGSTTDSEIASQLTSEEILGRFVHAKESANVADAERDRLRKFIQEHMSSGRYGRFILEITLGTARMTASKEGNRALQSCVIIDMGLLPKIPKAGTSIILVNEKTGEQLGKGFVLDNTSLYSRNPPTNVGITEIPDEN